MTTYVLELWNPFHKRYEQIWSGTDEERAHITFNKSYNSRFTRRLTRISTEVIKKAKAEKLF